MITAKRTRFSAAKFETYVEGALKRRDLEKWKTSRPVRTRQVVAVGEALTHIARKRRK